MDMAVVTARLDTGCPALGGRIGTALQLADLLKRGQAPTTPAAFTLPLGLRGGAPNAATGLYRQPIERTLGIILILRSANDPLGARIADELDALIKTIVELFAGWGPEEAIGVLRFSRGQMLELGGGTVTYQLEFILDDQLRIAR